jgi:hypothetical protein
MTTFPELIPSARTYIPGSYPHTPHGTYSGAQVRVRHSNAVTGIGLRLFFRAITTAEMLEIKAHYAGQRGGFESFDIPDELLSGMDTPADFTTAGQRWLHAARPEVVDIPIAGNSPINRHDVTVELVSTPEKPAIYVPRVVYRLTALAPTVVGTPSSVDVPIVTFNLSALAPTVTASVVPFDPLSLSPVAWWDASDDSTITEVSGRISDWDDKSGNGWDLTQSTAGSRPSYTTAAINGLNVAEWPADPRYDFMTSASGTFEMQELYVVLDYSGTSIFATYNGILTSQNDDFYITGDASATGLQVLSGTSAYINGDNTTNRLTNVFPEIESPCLLRVVSTTQRTTTSGVTVGRDRYLGVRVWRGYIGEMIVFDAPLSSGDRGDLETYLMDKWDI